MINSSILLSTPALADNPHFYVSRNSGAKMSSNVKRRSYKRAKRVEVTSSGLQSLQEALTKVIRVQNRLFGKAGLPGGMLLEEPLRIDSTLLYDTARQDESLS